MKAAFLTASVSRGSGGVFEISRRLAQTLAGQPQMGVEVFGLQDAYTQTDLPAWQPLVPHVFPVAGPRAYGFAPGLGNRLDDAGADVSHVHGLWMYPSLAAARWSRRARRPYLITIHGMMEPWALNHARWKKKLAAFLFEDAVLHGATCVQVNTQTELEHVRRYGLRNPVCVIPNGIDLPDTTPPTPPWQDRIARGRKVLLYLGRLHPKKGLPPLLQAWANARRLARATALDWDLVVAGWDQLGHEAELKAMVQRLELADSVHFVGGLFGEAKAAAYHHSHAFVLPSLSEGLPMSVLEAWAYRLPVLMTPQCNLSQGFKMGAAILIETTVDSITRGLLRLFALNDTGRAAMAERGRQLVAEEFTWASVGRQMRDVYEWMVGGGARPGCVDAGTP